MKTRWRIVASGCKGVSVYYKPMVKKPCSALVVFRWCWNHFAIDDAINGYFYSSPFFPMIKFAWGCVLFEAVLSDGIHVLNSLYLQLYFSISSGLWENSWRPAVRYRIQPPQSSETLQISQRCHQSQIQTSALIQIQNYSLCDNSGTLTHRRNTGMSVCVEYRHWLILHHGI